MANLKIKLDKGQKLFFTSDTHYNHANICEGTTSWVGGSVKLRPFPTIFKMNQVIIDNINEVIGQDDILIHLGDWSFGGFDSIREFRNRINCRNIYILLGNHDEKIGKNQDNIQDEFLGVFDYLNLIVSEDPISKNMGARKHNFVCCHFPIASWGGLNKGVIMLHGHVHFEPKLKLQEGKMMDIGVDGNNLKPYELSEILKIMRTRPIKSLFKFDHHEEER
jgi:calcineurin-like phosphoesterase family protein